MNAVEIRNLTKNFGPKQALSGLNMTVPVGAIYGFIGEMVLVSLLRKRLYADFFTKVVVPFNYLADHIPMQM